MVERLGGQQRKPSLKAVPPPLPEGEPLPALPGLVQADAEPAVDEILPAPVSSAAKPAQADGARSSVTSFAQLPDPEEDSKGKEEQEPRTPDARRRHQNSKDNGWDALAQRVQQTDTVREVLQQGDAEPRTSWWHIYEMLVSVVSLEMKFFDLCYNGTCPRN